MQSVKQSGRALVVAFVFMCLLLGARTQAQAYESSPVVRQSMVQWIIEQSKDRVKAAQANAWVSSILKWSAAREVDPTLVMAIIRHESRFNPTAVSPVGAEGLMQVWGKWHRDKTKGRSLKNPEVNIEVGTLILKECWERFDGHAYKALGCYLGGPPTQYFKNIQATHLALRKNYVEAQWVAEEHVREAPKLTYAGFAPRTSYELIPAVLAPVRPVPSVYTEPAKREPVIAPRVIVGDPLMHMASAALLMKQ